VVYALYDYDSQNSDELSFRDSDQLVVLRKGDDLEREWWWSKHNDREGYVPRNLLGVSNCKLLHNTNGVFFVLGEF
ncbi:apoptosis-stimulating of p53 protein 1, partial [Nephila pilipes]